MSLCVSQEWGWVLNTKAVDDIPEGQAPPVPPARTLPHSREQAALGLGVRWSDAPQTWLDPWSCRHVAPPTPAGRQHRAAWALSLPIQAVGVWGLSVPGSWDPPSLPHFSEFSPDPERFRRASSHLPHGEHLAPGAAGFPAQPSAAQPSPAQPSPAQPSLPLSPQLFPSSTSIMPLISD